jgi:hypothetical protein
MLLRCTLLTLLIAATAHAADLPPGATVLDDNLLWDVTDPDTAVVSPDGKQIAYISRGAIWRCSVAAGPPSKLADLPETMTAYLQEARFALGRNSTENLNGRIPRSDFEVLLRRARVFGLRWTPSQDGVVYGMRPPYPGDRSPVTTQFMHASLDGAVTEIAAIEQDVGDRSGSFDEFHLSADRKYLVAQAGVPLIWNVTTGRPQVTPFEALVPSATSGRYLGIEIDTRQMVLVDETFAVVKRFEFGLLKDGAFNLAWSPDERFVLCRQEREEPFNQWRGIRFDLETGEKRGFRGYYWTTDRCAFTGRRGEFVLYGARGFLSDAVDRMVGAQLWLFPDGSEPARTLIRYDEPEHLTGFYKHARRYGFPPVVANSDGSLFAMLLPRPTAAKPGYLYHFIDRDGTARPWTPYDPNDYLAPAQVLAFANGDQTIVARTTNQLLSIPLSEVLRSENPGP